MTQKRASARKARSSHASRSSMLSDQLFRLATASVWSLLHWAGPPVAEGNFVAQRLQGGGDGSFESHNSNCAHERSDRFEPKVSPVRCRESRCRYDGLSCDMANRVSQATLGSTWETLL